MLKTNNQVIQSAGIDRWVREVCYLLFSAVNLAFGSNNRHTVDTFLHKDCTVRNRQFLWQQSEIKGQISNSPIKYKILSGFINTWLQRPPILFPHSQAWLRRKEQQSGYLMRWISHEIELQAAKERESEGKGWWIFADVYCKHSYCTCIVHRHVLRC